MISVAKIHEKSITLDPPATVEDKEVTLSKGCGLGIWQADDAKISMEYRWNIPSGQRLQMEHNHL